MPFTPIFVVSNSGAANGIYWAQVKLPIPCVLITASVENSDVNDAEKTQLFLVKSWQPFNGDQEHFELQTGFTCRGINLCWSGEIVVDSPMTLVAQVKHKNADTYHRLEGLTRMLVKQ